MSKQFSPLLWLLVTVFFIRALMPVGFMPDFSGNQILTICSGTGISTIVVDKDNQPVTSDHRDQTRSAESCAFSLLSTVFLTDPLINASFIAPPVVAAQGMLVVYPTRIASYLLHNHYPSRAPPQFS